MPLWRAFLSIPSRKRRGRQVRSRNFSARSGAGPKLLGGVGMAARAAAPLGIGPHWDSRGRAAPSALAGTESHHQIATACNALSLNHPSGDTTLLAYALVKI